MADPQVDLAVEEATLVRLERLADGQSRIFRKLDRTRIVIAVVGFAALVAAILFANAYFNQQQTIDENRAAICNTAEAFTNALIASGPPPVDENARVTQQARIDAFGADLQKRLGLGCHLHLTVVSVPGG